MKVNVSGCGHNMAIQHHHTLTNLDDSANTSMVPPSPSPSFSALPSAPTVMLFAADFGAGNEPVPNEKTGGVEPKA
eukprot:350561-Chlamydomonas_euryale.AAC.14